MSGFCKQHGRKFGMIQRISDLGDPRLEMYANMTDLQLRSRIEPELGIFIAESEKVVSRALDAGYEPISLVVPEHRLDRSTALMDRFEAYPEADILVVDAKELEKLAGYEVTRGVLSAMRRKPLPTVESLLSEASRVCVLEGITNHANVGSVFRNAAALGVDAVIVSPDCCDPLYRRAVRVSMGTVFQVPWTRIDGSNADWLDALMANASSLGFSSAAFALRDDCIPLDSPLLSECPKLIMFFGTEGDGLTDRTIAACDHVVRIPMRNGVDSLNVAATSAVAFWQLCERY